MHQHQSWLPLQPIQPVTPGRPVQSVLTMPQLLCYSTTLARRSGKAYVKTRTCIGLDEPRDPYKK